jgi:nickel-dependent lactate racemase
VTVVGRAVDAGYLDPREAAAIARAGLQALPLDGHRVLVVIPDGTRTMPMPLMFETITQELGPRTKALDFLVALGTHTAMSDEQLTHHIGHPVVNGMAGAHRITNHRWDDPATFVTLGVIRREEVAALSGGLLDSDLPVALNRLLVEYDHVLICGPVFPHEVAGFSGGTKYLFPGVAAADIIHLTHWLGGLITSSALIGTADTPVRAVIDRAASMLPVPLSLLALVVTHEGIAAIFCGNPAETWRRAAAVSAQRHIVWLEEPLDRVLAVMPPMYADIWTAGKGVYKTEPAVADGGEVIVLAPHVSEVSRVHGRHLEQIGYHCRDYFLAQWDRFSHVPGGILAHSTHVKGLGAYDVDRGVESPRIRVTLATGIARGQCERVNLGYLDPARVRADEWPVEPGGRELKVGRAGEMLFRVGKRPVAA